MHLSKINDRAFVPHCIRHLAVGLLALLLGPAMAFAAPTLETSDAVTQPDAELSIPVTIPGGAPGELILLMVAIGGQQAGDIDIVDSSGADWVELDVGEITNKKVTLGVYARRATALDDGSSSATAVWANEERAIASVLRYSDVDELNTVRGLSTETSKSDSPTAPNAVSGLDDVTVLRLYAAESGIPLAYPPGMNNDIFDGATGSGKGDVGFSVADQILDAGDTGPALFEIANQEHWRGMTIILASAPVTAVPPGVNPLLEDETNSAFPVCSSSGIDGTVTTSGVVNTYYPGTASVAGGSTTISLGTARGAADPIGAGDLLLVMQMQDAVFNSSNTLNYGDGSGTASGSTSIGQTGLYEFAIAESFAAGTLTLERGLAHAYNADSDSSFQVIRVPRYDNLTLDGTLTAATWDGSTGAVLMVDVEFVFDLAGNTVDVSGLGYRGGLYSGGASTDQSADVPDVVAMATTPLGFDPFAEKGEGIAGTSSVSYTGGGYSGGNLARGAPGNAGGGGNDHNGGGGGGSNLGYGGRGGFGWSNGLNSGAFGGARFDGYSGRLLAGGGGGAGNTNGDTTGEGAAGAGIAIINAREIDGVGMILASGLKAADSNAGGAAGNDGAGGGGAGGTIVIRSLEAVPDSIGLKVDGGGGGDVYTANPHGPGGGGGAGVIYSNVALLGAVDILGGRAGIFFDTDFVPPAAAGTHGAEPGESGEVASVTDFPTPVGCDFPDEPASYNAVDTFHLITATGGSVTPLSMGPLVDFEPEFIASPDALADDLNNTSVAGAGDDEDGVNFRYPASDTLAADVTVFNPFEVDVKVCAWLDFNVNGSYDGTDEGYCQETDQPTTTLTFSWSGLGQIETFARFRISSREPLSAAFPNLLALDGEIESHKVIFPPGEDFGDAPLSYGDAAHFTVDPLILGAIGPDDETATLAPAPAANGDDTDNINDEDSFDPAGVVAVPVTMSAFATATLSNELTGTTDAAQLVGWIDFDEDGAFDNDCGGAPVDPDGDGLYQYPNYCERSLPMLTALSGDLIDIVVKGFADNQTNSGVADPGEALGINDGSVASLSGGGTVLTLDLSDTVDEGETLTVWANRPIPLSLARHATAQTSNSRVIGADNALAAVNGTVATILNNGVLTLETPDLLAAGKTIYLRASSFSQANGNCQLRTAFIETSPDDLTYTSAGTLAPTDCTLRDYPFTVPPGGGARYVRISRPRQNRAINVDALSYISINFPGPGEATIEVSPDNISFSPLGSLTETSLSVESSEFTVPASSGGARYVRFNWQSETVGVDAVGYNYARVEPCDLNASYGGANATDATFVTGNIPADCANASAGLVWTNIDNGTGVVPAGPTNARLRLTTDPLFFADTSPTPSGLVIDGEVEDYLIDMIPTAVTLGKVALQAMPVAEFLESLNVAAMSRDQLLAVLAAWDAGAAVALNDAEPVEIRRALGDHLDPDNDGNVAVLYWETLEERGTIGFYVERRLEGDSWERLNDALLPGLINAPMGGQYQLADPGATGGKLYEYRLIELEARGATRSYGPFRIEMQ